MINSSKHSCCWVLANGKYCKAKTSYVMKKGPDNIKRRKYYTFCNEHLSRALDEDTEEIS